MKMLDVLIEEFEVVEDPRVSGRTKHTLLDILVIGVLAVICGAETWEEIHDFGIARLEWLKRFVDLSSGIPSHDTFLRVFSIINPKHFELAFMNWVRRIRAPDPDEPDLIAIDGKTVCGTNFRKAGGGYANLHLVSAWSTQHGLVLGQARAKGRGSAEYSAAIEILDALDIQNKIITTDAGVAKGSFSRYLNDRDAKYILPVKRCGKGYFKKVIELFKDDSHLTVQFKTENRSHGRKESRTIKVIYRKDLLEEFNISREHGIHYGGLKTVAMVTSTRELYSDGPTLYVNRANHRTENPMKRFTNVRYFVSNLKLSQKDLLNHIRSHWQIENNLHWSLDVQLGEDRNRTSNQNAAQNLSVARKIALNLVKQDKSSRIGLKSKIKRAGWDLDYLEALLLESQI